MSSSTAFSPTDAALLASHDEISEIRHLAGKLLALSRRYSQIDLLAVDSGKNGVYMEKITAAAKSLGVRGINQNFVSAGGFEMANHEAKRISNRAGKDKNTITVLVTSNISKDLTYLNYLWDCLSDSTVMVVNSEIGRE